MIKYEDYVRLGFYEKDITFDFNQYQTLFLKNVKKKQQQLSVSDGVLKRKIKNIREYIEVSANNNFSVGTIQMPTNKKNYSLSNGEYIHRLDLELILKEQFACEVIINKKTKKQLSLSELLLLCTNHYHEFSTIRLNKGNENLNGSREIMIKGSKEFKYLKKGLLLFGKKNQEFLNGDYISVCDLKKFFQKYCLLKQEEVLLPDYTPPTNNILLNKRDVALLQGLIDLRIVEKDAVGNLNKEKSIMKEKKITDAMLKKEMNRKALKRKKTSRISSGIMLPIQKIIDVASRKKRWNLKPLFLAGALMSTLGIQINKPYEETHEIKKNKTSIEYEIETYSEKELYETKDEVVHRVLSKYAPGNTLSIPEGTSYYESSDYKYGGAKKEGITKKIEEQTSKKISLLKDGKIIATYEDISKLYETLRQENKDIHDFEYIISTNKGWINIEDIQNKNEWNPIIKSKEKIIKDTYKGVVENFSGDIKLNEETILSVVDKDGMILHNQTTILGNDGLTYQIKDLNLKTEEETKIIRETKEGNIDFNMLHMNSKIALLTIAQGLLGTVLLNRKEKKRKRIIHF